MNDAITTTYAHGVSNSEIAANFRFIRKSLKVSQTEMGKALAKEVGVLGTAGSDAHSSFEMGRALMTLPAFFQSG